MNAREVAALAPMPEMLRALGFQVSGRTQRCACILHDGSNRSAFSWTEAGLWKCHSCGAGGDRIALVRAVRNCGFHAAVDFLADFVGASYTPYPPERYQIDRARQRRDRAENAAWRVRDEVIRLRSSYRDGLYRAERILRHLGEGLASAGSDAESEDAWERMSRLAPAETFFLAASDYLNRADIGALVRFALASPKKRRALIFGEDSDNS
jgi:CHC2 zinc finger